LIDYPGDTGFMKARHTAVIEINKALAKADILIPFPVRIFDSGGEKHNIMFSKKINNINQQTKKFIIV
jgi:hypothetical protein